MSVSPPPGRGDYRGVGTRSREEDVQPQCPTHVQVCKALGHSSKNEKAGGEAMRWRIICVLGLFGMQG